ncbi:hypothetical protein ACOMHN_015158 [Nucella lapillus]
MRMRPTKGGFPPKHEVAAAVQYSQAGVQKVGVHVGGIGTLLIVQTGGGGGRMGWGVGGGGGRRKRGGPSEGAILTKTIHAGAGAMGAYAYRRAPLEQQSPTGPQPHTIH